VAYWVAVVARNAAKYLPSTINSLLEQTLRPSRIVVVDDGSTDATPDVITGFAQRYPGLVRRVVLPDRGYDIRRVPSNINRACSAAKSVEEYFMISGDDCEYPPNYAMFITSKMSEDNKLVVASGRPSSGGDVSQEHVPSGSGRMVSCSFWRRVGGGYPIKAGWETWLLYKAAQEGFRVNLFEKLVYKHIRPRGVSHQFTYWGAAMWTIGYHPLYAMGRIVRNAIKGDMKKMGPLKMLRGYVMACLGSDDVFLTPFEPELRRFVHNEQARAIGSLVRSVLAFASRKVNELVHNRHSPT
jgi:biofilm PGA synthesis N-glycosyltransferase PgaC